MMRKAHKFFFGIFLGILFFILPSTSYTQKLIINEFSNGPAGAQEYIELLVVDTATAYNCLSTVPPCIDIRGWIIDDNSGYHGTGGVASGCNRFSYDPMWQCVPLGTMILIYNNAEPNTSLPTDDLSMTDNNCKVVIPINNTQFFETNPTTPGAAACSYPATGWIPGGIWTTIGMANTGDCVRLVNLTGCEVFSLCYAAVNQNTQIYFASGGSGTDNVWYFNGGNPAIQSNWSEGCADPATCGSNNQTPGAPNNLANSNYIAQFNNNCQPITLLQVAPQQNINANCGCNGVATISAIGSIPGYTYLWTPSPPSGQGTATASGLCPGGVYKCVVTSAIGCKDSLTFNISGTNSITASVTGTALSCFGGNNASATASFGGGNGGINYSWSPAPISGQGTSNVTGLSAQVYTLTVSDAAGCTATATYTPTQPQQISSTIVSTPVSCFGGNNGTANVTTSGGTGNLNFVWAPGGSTSSSPSNLTAGGYTVTITDANGCTSSNTILIAQPSAVSSSTISTNVSCNGGSDGNAEVTATGGTPGYSYSWSPSGGTNYTATNLTSGNYTVTITDQNSCTATTTVNINEPALLTASVSSTNSVACSSGTNGSASVLATGGTASYYYSWAPSGGFLATANGLTAGNYTCTISDVNNCLTTVTVSINEPTPITLSVSTQGAPCGGSGGSASVQASGGSPGYNYLWSNNSQTTPTLGGLFAGTYTCYVTDANLCTDSVVAVIGTINGPSISIASSIDPTCFGLSDGQITSNVTGGVSPVTVSWSPSGGSSLTANNLSAGTYTVSATDANGCQNFAVTNISDPTPLNIVLSTDSVLCNGSSSGNATVLVTGGTPNYTIQWSNSSSTSSTINNLTAGNYSVTAIDANNCSVNSTFSIYEPSVLTVNVNTSPTFCGNSNGNAFLAVSGGVQPYSYAWSASNSILDSISNLAPGNYSVVVTDANNCSQSLTFTISATPTSTLSIVSAFDVSCAGLSDGSINVVASGNPPFTFSWFPSGGNSSGLTNLSPGTYICVMTDVNNCTDTITANISSPSPVSVSITATDALCSGTSTGTASVIATGGNGGFTYLWSPSGGSNNVATGLSAGVYSCTVTDANNCVTTSNVSIFEPTPIQISLSATQVSCLNPTASINTNVSGGTPTYSFAWLPAGNGQNPSGLSAGNYSVTVVDNNGCVATQSVSIVSNIIYPNVDAGQNDTLSCLPNTFLSLNGFSSTPGVSYIWSGPGGFTSFFSSPSIITPGIYTLSVTNPINGCTSVDSVLILQSSGPIASFSQTPSNGNAPLSVTFVNGSSGATSFFWDFGNGSTSNSVSDNSTYLIPGIYQITLIATNTEGCSDTAIATVSIFEEFFIEVPNVFTPNGDGSNDVFFIPNKGIESLEVLIYNRWGSLVYTITQPSGSWDGKTSSGDAPDGTYFFLLKAKGMNGESREQNGYLLLSR